MGNKITILGAGSWGTALAVHLAQKDYRVALWTRNEEYYNELITSRENRKYLPGIKLKENIDIYLDVQEAVKNSSVLILSVPSHAVRSTLKLVKSNLDKDTIIVNTAKGFEESTLLRLSQVIQEELDGHECVVLSGPSHAEEVSKFLPTAVVASSQNQSLAEDVQDLFMSSNLRVYTNPDLCGVEIGGALKNIIALATGIADGLGYGDNTRAALITRGLAEIARLGVALGANPLTFAGLTGIGDLIVTCNSMHSRNRRAGILLGQGLKLTEVLQKIGMVVEGVRTTKVALQLAQKVKVEMPITQEVYHVIYLDKDPRVSVYDLMGRQKTHEVEEVANSKINW